MADECYATHLVLRAHENKWREREGKELAYGPSGSNQHSQTIFEEPWSHKLACHSVKFRWVSVPPTIATLILKDGRSVRIHHRYKYWFHCKKGDKVNQQTPWEHLGMH